MYRNIRKIRFISGMYGVKLPLINHMLCQYIIGSRRTCISYTARFDCLIGKIKPAVALSCLAAQASPIEQQKPSDTTGLNHCKYIN